MDELDDVESSSLASAPNLADSFRQEPAGIDFGPLFLFIAALLSVLMGVVPGRILLPSPNSTDLKQQPMATEIAPWTTYAGQRLANGGVPLWNPHTLLGAPLLGNGEVGVFYPTIIFHMFLPPKWAFPAAAAAQLWLAGLGA